MQKEQIRIFLERFTTGTHTEEEHQAFTDWLQTAPIEEVETIAEEYKMIAENRLPSIHPNQELIARVEAALDQWELGALQEQEVESSTLVIRMWRKIAVAAAVVGLIGLGVWFFTRESVNGVQPIAENRATDIEAPKMTRAMITLADGRTVALDSVASGMLAVQSDVKVVKNEKGEIVYQSANGQTQKEIPYNTLYNPRGSKVVSLTLADGTKVWLNSESSLRFPVAFVGNERKVIITGEAYFEVSRSVTAAGAKQTFLVESKGVTTAVLGTHFNVNAYEDEPEIKVTLLEGSVKVSSKARGQQSEVVIKPGQQAIANSNSPLTIDHSPDLDQVMAWRSGIFNFGEGTDIKEIMRQVARWYDVEVEYKNHIQEEFGGSIPRDVNVSKMLEKFEMTGQVKFKIQGGKVIVSAP